MIAWSEGLFHGSKVILIRVGHTCYSLCRFDFKEYRHGPTECPPSTRPNPRTARPHPDLSRLRRVALGGLQGPAVRHHLGRHPPAPAPGPALSRSAMPPPRRTAPTRAGGALRPPGARVRPRRHRHGRHPAACPAPQRPRDPCRVDPPRSPPLPPHRRQPARPLRRTARPLALGHRAPPPGDGGRGPGDL